MTDLYALTPGEVFQLALRQRRLLQDISICRLNNGNGTICRGCWERAGAALASDVPQMLAGGAPGDGKAGNDV